MRGFWILAACAGLVGCMTTQGALDASPTIHYVASAPLPIVRACIIRGAQKVKDIGDLMPVPPPQIADLPEMTKINFENEARMFVELRPVPEGTDVRYVRHMLKVPPSSRFDDVVSACENPAR